MKIKLNASIEKILNIPYAADVVDANRDKAIEKHGKAYIIDFGVGDPTDETPEVIRSAMKKAVDSRKTFGYPASTGALDFQEAVVSWYQQRYGVTLAPGEIAATYGTKFAVSYFPQRFITPNTGEVCLVPNPGYPPFAFSTLIAGAEPYYLNLLPQNNFEPDLDNIPEDVLKRARILFLNFPNSPTGKLYTDEYLQKAVDFCNQHNIILVSDECYADIYFDRKTPSIFNFKGAENCAFAFYSFSKRSRMTSYAAGFAVTKNPELMKAFKSIMAKSIQGLQPFISDACITALKDNQHVEDMQKKYKERMRILIPALEAAGLEVVKPDGTFFMWVKIPKNLDSVKASEKLLLEKGINTMPGSLISETFNSINPGARFIRFALIASTEKTKEAAERLKGYTLK